MDDASPASLVRANVPAMLAVWARFVDELARNRATQAAPIDIREQVLVRHEIARRLRVRPASAETRDLLREFDDAFRDATVLTEQCVFGAARAEAEGWTATREWYFWRDVAAV